MKLSVFIIIAFFSILSFGSGCYSITNADKKTIVKKRATFELSCPKNQITVIKFNYRTYGASGCGRKAVYLMESCGGSSSRETMMEVCTAVLNSQSEKSK